MENPEYTGSSPLKPLSFGLLGVLLVASIFYLFMLNKQNLPSECVNLPLNKILGGEFVMDSTDLLVGRLSDTHGKVRLLNFGYTQCPDVCPVVLARMVAATNKLKKVYNISPDRVLNIFISFDHERDTVESLQEYLPFFDKDFVGFAGGEKEVQVAARAYGVFFEKDNHGSANQWGYSHSDYIYLIDREGYIRKLYNSDSSTDEIVNDLRCLM